MNIVYACDNNFAEMLGISMISLFENNKNCCEINLYVLDDEISDTNKNNFKKIADKYCRNTEFIPVKNMLDTEMKQRRGSVSTFSRLYLSLLIPVNVNKILYLDCDLLVLQNLQAFYDTDISDYYCAGVGDCLSYKNLELIGLKKNSNYFNAGVLLINLDKWRKEGICDRFIAFSGKFNNNVPYADQGVINGVLSERSLKSELKYNCYTALFDFTYENLLKFRKPPFFYSKEEVYAAKKNPAIVHFTTSFLSLRPWVKGCRHPFVNEWLQYKKMSPWSDVPLQNDNRSGKLKFAVRVYNTLPESAAVGIAGILHAKLVPMLKKIF